MQPFRELQPFHAGSTVAVRAAESGIGLGSGLNRGGVAKRGWRVVVGVAIDRRGSHAGQRPGDGGGVFGRPGDAIITAEEKGRSANADRDRQSSDCRKEAHLNLRSSCPQMK
jgi:hypothetical protein